MGKVIGTGQRGWRIEEHKLAGARVLQGADGRMKGCKCHAKGQSRLFLPLFLIYTPLPGPRWHPEPG